MYFVPYGSYFFYSHVNVKEAYVAALHSKLHFNGKIEYDVTF